MLIPQSIAYAVLAGLPAIYGLYAGLVPLFLYPFLGSSRQLSVGPVALVSVLVLSGLTPFAEPGSEAYINLAIVTGLLAGIFQIILSVFRLGFMVKFLSEPVLIGFTAAAAIIIAVGQVPGLLGIEVPRASSPVIMLEHIFWKLKEVNLISFLIGGVSLAFLLIMKKVKRSFPSALVVVFVGILSVYLFQLNEMGVKIIGEVPQGLPAFTMPRFSNQILKDTFSLVIVIGLLSFIESLAISKSVAQNHGNYHIDSDRELFALGLSKLAGGLFQAYPTTGSFSRTAVNDLAGAKTGVASLVTATMVALCLLYLSKSIYYLSFPVLAAIILAAVFGLINIEKAKFYKRVSRHDFWVMMITFAGTLLLGIKNGVLLGIFLSVGYILYRSSQPHYAVLGCLETKNGLVFRNIDRFSEAKERDDLLIIRFDAPLYFANVEYMRDVIWKEINNRPTCPRYLILDFSSIITIDATGLEIFSQITNELKLAKIQLIMTNVQGAVRDKLTLSGLMEKIGKENQFLVNKDAYTFTANPHDRSKEKMKYASQTGDGFIG